MSGETEDYESTEGLNKENLERLKELKKKSERVRVFTATVAGSVSAIAVGITLSLALGLFSDEKKVFSRNELTEKLIKTESVNEQQAKRIEQLEKELKGIGTSLNTLSSLPEGSEWKTEASKITQRISQTENKLGALGSALTVNPAKALAMLILRKDLENTEENLRTELLHTKSEINRIYDQNKWFLGLMFTMALSVLGTAVSNFVSKKDI